MSDTEKFSWMFKGVTVWSVVQAGPNGEITLWVTPGWYRRLTSPEGVISLLPLAGWRLWRHRILWGFANGLVDAR